MVALVTGASSGIGKATAIAFAHRGADLVISGRNRGRLSDTEARIRAMKREVIALAGDLKEASFRQQLVGECEYRFHRLDSVVNAAGIIGSGTLESTSIGVFSEMFEINTTSVFHIMQLALPLLQQSSGSVVNVSSVTGLRSFPGVLAYCVSKAAVDQLTRCAALELAPHGVRVNAVNPGVVVTNLHRAGGMDEPTYKAFLERSRDTHPLGRVGSPEEVAELILFLASRNAGWITGETISIDGGRAQTCAR